MCVGVGGWGGVLFFASFFFCCLSLFLHNFSQKRLCTVVSLCFVALVSTFPYICSVMSFGFACLVTYFRRPLHLLRNVHRRCWLPGSAVQSQNQCVRRRERVPVAMVPHVRPGREHADRVPEHRESVDTVW